MAKFGTHFRFLNSISQLIFLAPCKIVVVSSFILKEIELFCLFVCFNRCILYRTMDIIVVYAQIQKKCNQSPIPSPTERDRLKVTKCTKVFYSRQARVLSAHRSLPDDGFIFSDQGWLKLSSYFLTLDFPSIIFSDISHTEAFDSIQGVFYLPLYVGVREQKN